MQIVKTETIITIETEDISKFELIGVRFGRISKTQILLNLEFTTDEEVSYLIKALGCQLNKSCTVLITLKEKE